MRAIIDIDAGQDMALKRLARSKGVSRAHLVREAIDRLLGDQPLPSSPDAAFGLWRDKRCDGVEYERRLREEWPA